MKIFFELREFFIITFGLPITCADSDYKSRVKNGVEKEILTLLDQENTAATSGRQLQDERAFYIDILKSLECRISEHEKAVVHTKSQLSALLRLRRYVDFVTFEFVHDPLSCPKTPPSFKTHSAVHFSIYRERESKARVTCLCAAPVSLT